MLKASFWGSLVVAALLPFLVRRLPMEDLPEHVLMAEVLTHYDDAGSDFCLHFVRDLRLKPYIGYFGIAWLVAPIAGAQTAARIAVALYLSLTPLAVRWYVAELAPGRADASILAIPALFCDQYYLGFLNFLLGVPLVFAGMAALLHVTRTGRWLGGAAFLPIAALAYLCHAADFLVLVLAGAIVAIAARGSRRWMALGLVGLVAAVAAWITPWADVVGRHHAIRYVSGISGLPPAGPERGLVFRNPLYALVHVLQHVQNEATMLDAALWGLPVGALLLARWRGGAGGHDGARRERFVLPVISAALLAIAPDATSFVENVAMKHSAFLFFSLPALVPARLLDRRGRATFALFAVASVGVHAVAHARFDREARGFDAVMAAVPRGATVLPLMFAPGSSALSWHVPYLHYGHLVQAERGGLGREIETRPQYPVRMRPEGITGMTPFVHMPWLVTARVMAIQPDFVVMKGRGAVLLGDRWVRLAGSGDWSVFGPALP
ncbi:MAG: hypothetical protein U0166_21125 [Acidobacteriota bacterium]